MFHTRWLEPSNVGCWSITHLTRRDFWTWETVPTKCWVNRILQHELGNQPRQQTINQARYKLFLCLFSWCSCFFFQKGWAVFLLFVEAPASACPLCLHRSEGHPKPSPCRGHRSWAKRFEGCHHHGNLGGPHPHHLRLVRDHSFVKNPLTRPYFFGGVALGGL